MRMAFLLSVPFPDGALFGHQGKDGPVALLQRGQRDDMSVY